VDVALRRKELWGNTQTESYRCGWVWNLTSLPRKRFSATLIVQNYAKSVGNTGWCSVILCQHIGFLTVFR